MRSNKYTAVIILLTTIYLIITAMISFELNSITIFAVGVTIGLLSSLIYIFIKKDTKIFWIIVLGYLIYGTCYALFIYKAYEEQNGIPYYTSYYNDDQKFEIIGKDYFISEKNIVSYVEENEYVPNLQYGVYIFFLGKLHLLGSYFDGFHTFSVKMFQMFFLTIGFYVILIYLIHQQKYPNKYVYIFSTFFFLTPNLLFLSSFTFRESLGLLVCILYFFTTSKLMYSMIHRQKISVYIIASMVLIFLQYNIREIVAFIMIAFFILVLFISIKNLKYRLILLITIVGTSILSLDTILSVLDMTDEYVDSYSNYRATDAGGLDALIKNTPLLPLGIFIRGIYGFFQPSPGFGYLFADFNLSYNFINALNGMGTIVILSSLPFVIMGLRQNKILFVYWLLLYCVYLTSLTFRHLMLSIPFLLMLIVEGIKYSNENVGKRMKLIYLIYVFMILGVFTIFSLLKI